MMKEEKKILFGWHCSEKEFKKFDGTIAEEYYDRFQGVLKVLKDTLKDVQIQQEIKDFLDRIEVEEFAIDSDLSLEITEWFKINGIRWIFISEDKPLTVYGENCYSVFFKGMSDTIQLNDNFEERSVLVIYFEGKNEPILKRMKVSDSLKKFLEDTDEETLKKLWEETKEFDNVGPTIKEFLGE